MENDVHSTSSPVIIEAEIENIVASRARQILNNPPTWLILGCMAGILAFEFIFFLLPSPLEFPMDDAYIHFVYADNLAAHGKLFFSDATETGIGTTSPLWVVMLAGLKLAGIPLHISAKILGPLMLLILNSSLYLVFRPILKSSHLLLAIFLITISGNLIWFSLSGMETMLFLALGMLSLLAYRNEKWIWLGLALGFMILARPEGLILASVIGLCDLWSYRRIRRGLVLAAAISFVLAAPWFLYVYQRTGYFLTSSAIGKQFTFNVGLNYIAHQNPALATFVYVRNLVYPFGWLIYLMLFALGGKSLPPPFLTNGSAFGVSSYMPSVWAIPVWLFIILPCMVAGARWLFARKKWIGWVQDSGSRPLIIFILWIVFHNLAFMLFIPVLGTASRYAAINHVALWILLAIGASEFMQRPVATRILMSGLIMIALVNNLYWNRVYDANIEHMQLVRIRAGEYLRDSLPANEYCAVFDIGAARYFSGRQMLDISGLTNPEPLQWFESGTADAAALQKGITCLILPGQTNTNAEGWLDFVQVLGWNDSSYFTLQELQVFEMDSDRWLLGYLPTSNQQRSIVIYKVIPVR